MRRAFDGAGAAPAEARERFLRAIVEQIPLARIAELHLFAPMRRGPHETGVAVVAAAQEAEGADTASGVAIPGARILRDDRLTIYRAHYRWTRKGPERGHWEVDVTAEAEAPLEAVGDVVRGVHRRAGDEGEPERLSPSALAAALANPALPRPAP